MHADAVPPESASPSSDAHSAPFAREWVTLSRLEHIELVSQAHRYRSLHERAVTRAAWREERYQKVLRQQKALGAQREAALTAQLELARARIRDLQSACLATRPNATRATNGVACAVMRPVMFSARVATSAAPRDMAAPCSQNCLRATN